MGQKRKTDLEHKGEDWRGKGGVGGEEKRPQAWDVPCNESCARSGWPTRWLEIWNLGIVEWQVSPPFFLQVLVCACVNI